MKTQVTPLLKFLRAATEDQRERCALLAGTKVNYLYQVATCKRPNPSSRWATSVEDATRTLHKETNGKLPVVTVGEMATMCAVAGLGE